MDLGDFSLSLAVRDIAASKRFYEGLGFEVIDGAIEEKWLIMRSGRAKIGLFQDMFDRNIITFNPPDVRAIQAALKHRRYAFIEEADEQSEGPAAAMLRDPDGNLILMDQL